MKKWICLLLSVFFIFSVVSIEAATKWVPFIFSDNAGGLNDGFSDTAIEDNEASDLQNVVFTTGGAIRKRQGWTKINPDSVATGIITGIHFYKQADGDRFLILVQDNGNISRMDYAGDVPDGILDQIGGFPNTITANDLADFAIGEDTIIIEDGIGTTPPLAYIGGANVIGLGTGVPNCTMVAYHKLHAFCAGDSTNPSRLFASNLGDISTWTSTDTIDVETQDGSIIRDLEPGLDALYIWKDKSIWRLSGTDRDNFVLERMVDGTGTLSRRSVAKLENQFLFVTNQGDIAVYDGGINVKIISHKIQGSIDNANFTRFKFSPGVVFDNDYYLSYSLTSVAQHNRMFVFDSFHRAFTKFEGINANAFTVAETTGGREFLAFSDYNGFINQYPDTDADDGGAIDFFWTSKNFNFPQLATVGGGVEKVWKVIRTFVEGGNYTMIVEQRADFEATGVQTVIDLGGDQPLWGTAVYGTALYGVDAVIVSRIEVNKIKDFFQVKFSDNDASEPITIRSYQLFIEPTSRM